MTWVRLDEQFAQHPKTLQAGPLGLAMQVAALCYCNLYLTDGYVPAATAATLLRFDNIDVLDENGQATRMSWQHVVGALVDAGLWITVPGGWEIHDFNQYQPTREQVLADREASRQRQQKLRKSRRDKHGSNTVTSGVSHGGVAGDVHQPRTSKEVRGRRSHANDDAPNAKQQLLNAATKYVTDWNGSSSDAFDEGLDELEQLVGARLTHSERSNLWDQTLNG